MVKAETKSKPEAKIIREEIPHVLVPGEMRAVLELIVKDKDGKVTEKRVMRSESFVRQFTELLFITITSNWTSNPYPIRDTGNVVRWVYTYREAYLRCDAGAGNGALGVVVGTGTVAPTIDDYALGAIIAHGTGAGQLQYSAMTFGAPASDATTSQFTLTRDFANGSGGAITVNEIGLFVQAYDDAYQYFMTIRDVIAGGISVPNGQTLTVNYRIQAVI